MNLIYIGIALLVGGLLIFPQFRNRKATSSPATASASSTSTTVTQIRKLGNNPIWVAAGLVTISLIIGSFFFSGFILVAIGLMVMGGFLLWMNKLPTIGGWILTGGVLLAGAVWLFGPENIEWGRKTVQAVVSGQPAPPPPPLSAEEQAARLARAAQEAELAQLRAAAEAAARSQAEEADRLTRQVTSQLPTSVLVPHCNDGWSEPVIIPGGWRVRSSWSGRVTRTQYLNEGMWRDATTLTITVPVEAFRYCTTSRANLNLNNGNMPLAWRPY